MFRFVLLFFAACTGASPLEGDVANGSALYVSNCESCHGAAGIGASGPALNGESEGEAELIDVITNGDGDMPAFGESLSDQDIADVAAYVQSISSGA